MEEKTKACLDLLIERYPVLASLKGDIYTAYAMLRDCYEAGGKLLLAGNGGSCADAEHIVGELMKGFKLPRKLSQEMCERLEQANGERGPVLAACLQQGLPAIALSSHQALNTAFMNDVDGNLMFAQQLGVLGCPGDVFLAISTSGNSRNVHLAATVAHSLGLKVLGMTGEAGGRLAREAEAQRIFDAAVRTVAPVLETSWMTPPTSPRYSARTGTT